MAWSTLPTYSAGAVLTAAQMNAIKDNINETCAATANAAGDLVYSDAANSMGSRLAIGVTGSIGIGRHGTPVAKPSRYCWRRDLYGLPDNIRQTRRRQLGIRYRH